MKLFLFDFDGVLVESLDIYEKIVSSCLTKINNPLTRGREEFLELFDGNFYESLTKRGVNLNEFMETSCTMLASVDYQEMKPVAAMVPVIRQLQQDNTLLVISSNDSATIRKALPPFGYDGYFREVLGSDFMFSKKEKIAYALDKYKTAPQDSYYIGDTSGDIREGRAAGVKTIGVTWGWHTKEKIAAADPDYLINAPVELLNSPIA